LDATQVVPVFPATTTTATMERSVTALTLAGH
jgi:hypothetical protein